MATSGIEIRPYRAADAGGLYEAARESVEEVYPWLPWCRPDFSREDAEVWATLQEEHFAEGIEYEFVITDGTGRYLGGCGINQLNSVHRFANLGYWVRTSAARRGVATEAVRLASRFAFAKTDLLRLEIVCAVSNTASRRVAEKSGASLEGILKNRLYVHGRPHDAAMYSLVKPTA